MRGVFCILIAMASWKSAHGDQPLWLLKPSRLHSFQSTPSLPDYVDVLIVGAGLTGASAAYHLAETSGLSVAVVDRLGVGEGASGHNGGNLELMPENFIDTYSGLVGERLKYINIVYPGLDSVSRQKLAVTQAETLLRFGQKNAEIFRAMLAQTRVQADFSPAGWLRLANNAEDEAAIASDVPDANRLVGAGMDMWTREQIRARTGIETPFGGRMTPGFGNYHPYKFVTGIFEHVIGKGVQVFTQTEVTNIDWSSATDQPITVETSRGKIRAGRVILATDAYTPRLVPQLSEEIEPYQSQVLAYENVPNRLGGLTITEENGDLYYNGPLSTHYVDARGVLHMTLVIGGGPDRPVLDVLNPQLSPEAYALVARQAGARIPEVAGRPASRTWTGVFGFTPDRLPILDFITPDGRRDRRVTAFVGTQGYGGCLCMLGGKLVAQMARGASAPVNTFTRARFKSCETLFVR